MGTDPRISVAEYRRLIHSLDQEQTREIECSPSSDQLTDAFQEQPTPTEPILFMWRVRSLD